MSAIFSLNGDSLPDLIRTKLANHLARLDRAANMHALELAQERVEGFVEGVQAARALSPATIEVLFIAVDVAATARREELSSMMGEATQSETLKVLVSQHAVREVGLSIRLGSATGKL